jgi:hypothetical protein
MPIKKVYYIQRKVIFTTSGAFVVPSEIYRIWVTMVGGGGGGGGGGGENTYGFAGGNGGDTIVAVYSRPYVPYDDPKYVLYAKGGLGGSGGMSGYNRSFFYNRSNINGYNGQNAKVILPWYMRGATGGQGGIGDYGGNGGIGGGIEDPFVNYTIAVGGLGDAKNPTPTICEGDSSYFLPPGTGSGAGGGGGGGGSFWGHGGVGGSKISGKGMNAYSSAYGAGGGGGKGGGGDGIEACIKDGYSWIIVIDIGGDGGNGGNSGDCIFNYPIDVSPGDFIYVYIGASGSGGSGGITYNISNCPPNSFRFAHYWAVAGGSNGYSGGDGAPGYVEIVF